GGELFNGQTEQAVRLRAELLAIAQEVGAESVDQVIYAWVRQLPSKPLAIIGSGKIERVRSALASQKIQLTREQWYRIWVASKGHGVP
ncbi:aldo/keto reductase, partial [Photobacterium damselae subsp. damselae]|nr:aldo/keto reductase [Photobacterium damselae subsp. damselae]